jgi:hypothetical protein
VEKEKKIIPNISSGRKNNEGILENQIKKKHRK